MEKIGAKRSGCKINIDKKLRKMIVHWKGKLARK